MPPARYHRSVRIYTRKGDTGTTGLLYGGNRVSKADLRTDAYGTIDETVSALGLARAHLRALEVGDKELEIAFRYLSRPKRGHLDQPVADDRMDIVAIQVAPAD